MNAPVDVLAVIRRHAESHRALAGTDAYSEQEAPRLEAALEAAAKLIAADKEYDAALANLTTINREIAERGWMALEHDALRVASSRLSHAVINRDRALARIGGDA